MDVTVLSHHRTEFWEAAEPLWLTQKRQSAPPYEVESLLALHDIPSGAVVLDLCCGPGRHAIELARRGCTVTGLDLTPAYLTEAARVAQQNGLSIELIEGDMRTFERPNSFDLVLNLGRSFGYFDDPADDLAVVDRAYASLRPGGVFVVETAGKEALVRTFRARSWREHEGRFFLYELTPRRNWSWIEDRTMVFDADGHRTEFQFAYRLYGASELVSLLEGVGFRHVAAYGDFAGTPYDLTSRSLIVAGRKGGSDCHSS